MMQLALTLAQVLDLVAAAAVIDEHGKIITAHEWRGSDGDGGV